MVRLTRLLSVKNWTNFHSFQVKIAQERLIARFYSLKFVMSRANMSKWVDEFLVDYQPVNELEYE